MRGFGLTVEPLVGGAMRVTLRGELDFEHAYTFDEEVRRLEVRRPECLVIDLSDLAFVDSSGLARLLAAHRRARRERRRVVFLRPTAPVRRLMALTAVDDHLEIVSELRSGREAGLTRQP
jgi:anti-sigma B factor antagonist